MSSNYFSCDPYISPKGFCAHWMPLEWFKIEQSNDIFSAAYTRPLALLRNNQAKLNMNINIVQLYLVLISRVWLAVCIVPPAVFQFNSILWKAAARAAEQWSHHHIEKERKAIFWGTACLLLLLFRIWESVYSSRNSSKDSNYTSCN